MSRALASFITESTVFAFGLVMKMASMLRVHHRLWPPFEFLNSMEDVQRRWTSSSCRLETQLTRMKMPARLASLIQSFHSPEASHSILWLHNQIFPVYIEHVQD